MTSDEIKFPVSTRRDKIVGEALGGVQLCDEGVREPGAGPLFQRRLPR